MNNNIINPPAVIREVRSLSQIEADIDRESGRLKHTKLRLGRLLLEAKEQVSHGGWEAWVEARGIKMRSAQRYITLAKSDNLTHLPDDQDVAYPHDPQWVDCGIAILTPVGIERFASGRFDLSSRPISWKRLCEFDGEGKIKRCFMLVGLPAGPWCEVAELAFMRMAEQVRRHEEAA